MRVRSSAICVGVYSFLYTMKLTSSSWVPSIFKLWGRWVALKKSKKNILHGKPQYLLNVIRSSFSGLLVPLCRFYVVKPNWVDFYLLLLICFRASRWTKENDKLQTVRKREKWRGVLDVLMLNNFKDIFIQSFNVIIMVFLLYCFHLRQQKLSSAFHFSVFIMTKIYILFDPVKTS